MILKTFSLIFILTTTTLNADSLTFENAGRFDGLLQDDFEPIFGLAPSLAYDITILDNCRHLLSVDEANEESPIFPNSTKLNLFNMYDDRSDQPRDAVGALMQRLFPREMVPNQGATNDPLRNFTPTIIGAIFEYIYTVDVGKRDPDALTEIIDRLENPKTYTNITNRRAKRINKAKRNDKDVAGATKCADTVYARALQSRRKNKNFKAIGEFVLILLEALEVQETHHGLYPEYLVERTLMAFAIQKATAEPDQTEEMLNLYQAMPSLLKEDFAKKIDESEEDLTSFLNKPFTHDAYNALKARLESEGTTTLEDRDKFMMLYGAEVYDRVLPKEHFYTNAHYTDPETGLTHSYPNCGAISLLNTLNMLLFDFQEKCFRIKLLEQLDYASPALMDFYRDFPTPESQFTPKAQQRWTDVVSNLQGFGIYYKRGGVAEIMNGLQSMAGVLRALFPNEKMTSINTDPDLSPLEKAELSLIEFFGIFTTEVDQWEWSIDQAPEDTEHEITKNTSITLNLKKKGDNAPVISGSPCTDDLIKWIFKQGHFVAKHTLNPSGDIQEKIACKRLEEAFSEEGTELSALDIWLISTTQSWMQPIFGLFLMNLEDHTHHLNRDAAQSVAKKMILTPNRHNPEMMSYINATIIAMQEEDYYLMATNIVEQLPQNDTTTIFSLLLNFLNKDGTDKPLPENLPKRFLKVYGTILKSLEDPQIVMNCLLRASQPGIFHYFANKVTPEMLTLEHAEKLALGLANSEYSTPEIWNKYFELCGRHFLKSDGSFDVDKFFNLKEDKKSYRLNMLLFCSHNISVLEYFNDKKYLDFNELLQPCNDGNPTIKLKMLTTPFPKHIDVLEFILQKSDITKEKILSADPDFYSIFLYHHTFNMPGGEEIQLEQYKRLIHLLGVTKEDFFKDKKTLLSDGEAIQANNYLLYNIISSPIIEVRRRALLIIKTLGISRAELLEKADLVTEETLRDNGFLENVK